MFNGNFKVDGVGKASCFPGGVSTFLFLGAHIPDRKERFLLAQKLWVQLLVGGRSGS